MKSQPTWMPEEVSSNLTTLHDHKVWRMVEAQNQVATFHVADSLPDQALLEDILEGVKPPMPEGTEGLHYLLGTPFRYKSSGSRFRRPGLENGVFYSAGNPETCAYETAFYRALFFAESPELEYPAGGLSLSAFSTTISSTRVLDLTSHPTLSAYASLWEDYSNYEACQKLADDARAAGVQVIVYKSVRDPLGRENYAVLDPDAFHSRTIASYQTWNFVLSASGVYMHREFPFKNLELPRTALEADIRFQCPKPSTAA